MAGNPLRIGHAYGKLRISFIHAKARMEWETTGYRKGMVLS